MLQFCLRKRDNVKKTSMRSGTAADHVGCLTVFSFDSSNWLIAKIIRTRNRSLNRSLKNVTVGQQLLSLLREELKVVFFQGEQGASWERQIVVGSGVITTR